jgi:hypothetical protein
LLSVEKINILRNDYFIKNLLKRVYEHLGLQKKFFLQSITGTTPTPSALKRREKAQ